MHHEAVPKPRSIADALEQSAALKSLRARIEESQQRHAAALAAVPESLRPHLRAGPVDDEGWTLLAANAAVAAKTRQWQPQIEAALAARGWIGGALRVRVQRAG